MNCRTILKFKQAFLALISLSGAAQLWGASYYTTRLDDPHAVYLTRDGFPVHGDEANAETWCGTVNASGSLFAMKRFVN